MMPMWSTSGSHISLAVKIGSTPILFPAWIPMKWCYNTDWGFINEYVITKKKFYNSYTMFNSCFMVLNELAHLWFIVGNLQSNFSNCWSSSGTLVPNLLKSCSWVYISHPQQVVQSNKKDNFFPKFLLNAVEIVYGSLFLVGNTYMVKLIFQILVSWGLHNVTLLILGFL